jgi:hypothetical protein
MKVNADHIKALEFMDKEDLLTMVKSMMGSGIALNFYGKRTAQEIDKKVRPHSPSSYLSTASVDNPAGNAPQQYASSSTQSD